MLHLRMMMTDGTMPVDEIDTNGTNLPCLISLLPCVATEALPLMCTRGPSFAIRRTNPVQ